MVNACGQLVAKQRKTKSIFLEALRQISKVCCGV
jgi:hypothetical protein